MEDAYLQMKKHSKKLKVNKIQIICVFIFTIGSLIISYDFYCNYKDEQNNKKIANIFYEKKEEEPIVTEIVTERVTVRKTEKMILLEELQKESPDIIGWIVIPGTNINYLVLQTMDNSYYLTHNYKKEYSKNGSIFLDKDFDIDKPSTNYLIYGHRNKNGLMFDDLINYKKEEFYKEHPAIQFTTLKEDSEYEIIAVFLSRVYYKSETNVFRYYYFTDLNNQEDFDYYVNNSKEASLYDVGKTADYGDRLLTLSTCEYSQKDGRLVIVAKKVKNIEQEKENYRQ